MASTLSDPKIRQTGYLTASALLIVLGIVQVWAGAGFADATADLSELLNGVITLLGGSAPAVAALKVKEQVNQGLFDITTSVLARQLD